MFKSSRTGEDNVIAKSAEAEIENLDKDQRRERRNEIKQKIKALVEAAIGTPEIDDSVEGIRMMRLEKYGVLDLELYSTIQILGYAQKANFQWVPEEHIEIIAKLIKEALPDAQLGLCHGTRKGQEQAWLAAGIGGDISVVGTEIAEAAASIPNTIVWDFHDVKEEWKCAVDFIYSNSWDHSYDPQKLLAAWISCLKPGGRMYLDHSHDQSGSSIDFLGLFGAEEGVFVDLVNKAGKGIGKVIDIENGVNRKGDNQIKIIVFERSL